MNVEEYRTLFVGGSLVLMLVAVAPTLSLFIRIPSGSEKFSELWLLGPAHTAENYPFNVSVNEEYRLFVGVSNHLGSSSYYMVYVKFRNQTQSLPDASNPSPLPPLYEFQFFLKDGEVWEAPLVFAVQFNSTSMVVDYISINSIVFPVNCSSTWYSDRNGFYYQMFFELWLYNMTSNSFQYHNRFVGLWLNMTVS